MPLSVLVRYIIWPSDSGCGDIERSKYVHCNDRRDPEGHKVLIWGENESLPEFITPRELTSIFGLPVTLEGTTLLKLGLGILFCQKNQLMEVLSFSGLLIH